MLTNLLPGPQSVFFRIFGHSQGRPFAPLENHQVPRPEGTGKTKKRAFTGRDFL
jgi:hypothetical protein